MTKRSSGKCRCDSSRELFCGKDNKTYESDCDLKRADQEVQYKGACRSNNCICPKILRPVCSKSGKTYNNQCLMEC